MIGSLDLSDGRFWLDALQTIAVIALWLRRPGEDAGKRAEELEKRVAVHEERLRHMPTADELSELEGAVKAIRAQVEAMKDSVTRTETGVDRIKQFLMENR